MDKVIICNFYIHDPDTNHCIHYIPPETDPVGLCKQPGSFQCIQDEYDYLPKLSHSKRLTFTQCRQKYYFNYYMGITKKSHLISPALKYGTIWDRFQQAVYKNKSFKSEFEHLCKKYSLYPDQRARMEALFKSWFTIELKHPEGGEPQKEFYILEDDYLCNGFIDLAYSDHFIEQKASSDPKRYHKLFTIMPQLSIYFLSNPDYDYAIVEAVKIPQLKYNEAKENPEKFKKRCFDHIIKNAKEYYPGLNLDKGTYGKKFYRSEFPLDQIKKDFPKITRDIKRMIVEDSYYQNFGMQCTYPFECDYLSVCTLNGVVSEDIYDYKSKKVK